MQGYTAEAKSCLFFLVSLCKCPRLQGLLFGSEPSLEKKEKRKIESWKYPPTKSPLPTRLREET
jgi:hypothetical protein